MSKFVAIQNTAMPVVEYQGKRVVTFAMIDKAHGRKKGTSKRSFNRHKAHFIEGEDYILLSRGQIVPDIPDGVFGNKAASGVLLTESGYLLIVKSFTDDLSWAIQKQLVNVYFRRNTLGELRHVEIPSLEELSQMPPEKAQQAKAEKESSYGHGKPGSAAMMLRRRELKQIRTATQLLINLHQLSLCDLGDFSKGGPHA